jgi:hypothetical protein
MRSVRADLRTKSYRAVLIVVMAIPRTARAQRAASGEDVGRPAAIRDSVPYRILEAETRARRMVSPSPSDALPLQAVFSVQAGSGARRCVSVGRSQYARSGDFVVGPFASYAGVWTRGYGKLAVVPVHGSPKSPASLVITASRLGATSGARIFDASLQHAAWYFYPTNIHLPSRGRWLLVTATSQTWGCFIFTLP